MEQPCILVFVNHYLPGYKSGGPVRSISNIAERLGDEFCFYVVTSDRDCGDTEPYKDIKYGEWNRVGKGFVRYLSPGELSWRKLVALLRDSKYDLIYLNSLFNPFFTIRVFVLRRLGLAPKVPVLLTPRGELSEGALALKPHKKKFYLTVACFFGLFDGINWHATTKEEKVLINTFFKNSCADVANNIPTPVSMNEVTPSKKQQGRLRIVSLSRIVEKKNLTGALNILKNTEMVQIDFDVYGTVEDMQYWNQCQEIISALPDNVSFEYKGGLPHECVVQCLAGYDLFLFPTLGENYGHVIAESFQAGTPVLISDQTPWKNLEERGVGWEFPLSESSKFVDVLERCGAMTDAEFSQFSRNAKAYGSEITNNSEAAEDHRTLFMNAIGRAKHGGI